ncbi:chromatin remodelling complex Rsc7/Swp82 subunit-domain-containing protein [Thelonectria olida]|uniref:Chromatin remodelling complex Rsc7/Swp82 subunit-domain-containing protein n=1 Tax=Thelonectria olida TaxID=1576542 RepID=A0A9P9ADU8_9HYPO|nr:chromatin remodelling complex Rsc7/Swp82 subunit-domain-containing protein [Thelonectria olida]
MPLAPAVSTLARQTIQTAFEELQRTITPADAREFPVTTLDHVRKAALDIENQLAARRSLRHMRRLSPLFMGLEHYSKVVDVLCNGTPFLPWIWAPISLILRVASEYVEAFEQIIGGYSRIASSLSRFEILSDVFVRNQDFQQTLAVFYADILEFHKYAYQFVRRSGWKLLFLTSWGRFQRRFDNILKDMERHETLIDLEANARNIAESRKMHQDIRDWREEQLNDVACFEEEQAANQYQSIVSWLKVDELDQLAIFDSISAEGVKYPGTCSWVLKNPKVSNWLQSKPDVPILWLQGTPGSGKSVISTQLVNFIRANSFVIHHFCTYSHESSTKYEQILRLLLLQLLRRDGELCAHVYKQCVLGKKPPTLSALEQLVQTLFGSMSNEPNKTKYVWIVLDGLDECEKDKQARVVNLMNQISSKSSSSGGTVCKVLISSRVSPTSSTRLRKRQTISLTDERENLEAAIRQYASKRLHSLRQKLGQLHIDPGEMGEIEQGIAKKADGMFLYARLVLDYLTTNIFYSADEIKSSVHQLPPRLTDFYGEILNRILVYLDSRSKDRIKCVLGWIAFARRPLRKLEFLSAISFSEGNLNAAHIAPKYILDICAPLIEERPDTSLTFIHVSVKEFLQSPSSNLVISEQDALLEHGVACITCLLSGLEVFGEGYQQQTRHLRVVRGLHGLHVYATEYWTDYLLTHVASAVGLDTSSCLFTLACQLAGKLDLDVDQSPLPKPVAITDERLKFLRQHSVLCKQVERALTARSLTRLEAEYLQEPAMDGSHPSPGKALASTGISALLESYQQTIRFLLSEYDHPGATAEELEFFKSQFRASAYTCRLSSCPRATLGFESDKLRQKHELTHIRRLQCTLPSCQYPFPFGSTQALRNHMSKHHDSDSPRKSIRRIARFKTQEGNPTASRVSRIFADVGRQTPSQSPAMASTFPMHQSYRRAPLTVDTQHAQKLFDEEDNSVLGDNILDHSSGIDSGLEPSRESFDVGPPLFSPKPEDWHSVDMQSVPSNNPFIDQRHSNNPFMRLDQQHKAFAAPGSNWSMGGSGTCTPLQPFDSVPAEYDPNTSIFHQPMQAQSPFPNPGNMFSSLPGPSPFIPLFPQKDWMHRPPVPFTTDLDDQTMKRTEGFLDTTEGTPSTSSPPRTTSTKSTLKALPTIRDHTTDQLNQTGDEYLPREIDEFGERKVATNGTLQGDREYKCRTFLVPNRGDKLFMLSTECARVLGYRDSYVFFKKNRSLYKIIANQEEKDDLVQQEILPFSYRSRQMGIVTARSMFRQFGSRVIVNGRRVLDDYWETKAREQGFTVADLA